MEKVTRKYYNRLVNYALTCRRMYYQHAISLISDYDYDMMEKRIKEIEKKHPKWLRKDSPSLTVGY